MSMARNGIEHVADYFPYGKILREYVESDEERFLTTQHERDRETGLDYRGARYYDADVARFLSLDPLATRYLDQSPYHYVLGNPIKYIDPTGKSSESTGEESTGWTENHVRLNEVFGDAYGFNSSINTSISKGNGKYVLGIHSNAAPDDDFDAGHAWISITSPDGVITTYGLWPDDHRYFDGQDPNGTKTDIRIDTEAELKDMRKSYTYHRYTDITETQYKQFLKLVNKNVEWGYTYTCAS